MTAGAETRVRIEGLQGKSEGQVLEMIGDRLVHVRASPASPPLADDAAFLLRQTLRKDGYAGAAVDWRIAGREEIVLQVREGGRSSLGQVTVTGVEPEDAKRFSKLFAKPAEKDRPHRIGAPPFREQDVETGLSYLRQDLNARGCWAATAEVTSRRTDAATGAVDLTIAVKPGAIHRIAAPAVTADGSGSEAGVSLAGTAARPFVGLAATTGNLNAMRLAVEEAITSQGYPNAGIRMGRTLGPGVFQPEFSIQLGERVRLNRIRIEGLERTKPRRVANRVTGMEGDWYDEAAMNKRLRELLATGAFSSARVETTAAGSGRIDATLHFEEARAREVSLAAGAGSYQGFITRATYADRNLLGNLWGLNTGLELGSRGVLGEARLTNPWLLGSDVSASGRFYALIYGREGYDTYETGLDGRLSWKPGDHYTADLLAGYSLVSLSDDGLPSYALGETDYTNPRLRLTQTWDYRDNPVLSKTGWHVESPLEIGAAIGDVSTSYARAGLAGGWFHGLGRNYQIGLGGELGVLVPSGDGGDLPIDLRLFNGGARSVRSFPERELGPTVNGYPTGGEAMWNANAELIRSLSSAVKAVAFFDAGSLSRDFDDLGSAGIEMAAGLGIRLELPIGPIRFEYGYNLTRDSGEPAGAFHFAIGNAF
jgi:outer membrane protein assembly factor BamA